MATDAASIIHMAITGVTSITMAIFAYLQIRAKQNAKSNDLATKLAVLEERIDNEIKLVEKLDQKLDDIQRQL